MSGMKCALCVQSNTVLHEVSTTGRFELQIKAILQKHLVPTRINVCHPCHSGLYLHVGEIPPEPAKPNLSDMSDADFITSVRSTMHSAALFGFPGAQS